METKKETKPTKKALINEIERLDTEGLFDVTSQNRANLKNAKGILILLKRGVK
jgi:hypothetical protein